MFRKFTFLLILFLLWLNVGAQVNAWTQVSIPVSLPKNSFSCFHTMKVKDNFVHVVYTGASHKALCYSYSNDYGQTWKTEIIEDSAAYPEAKYAYPFDVDVIDKKTGKTTKGRIDHRYAEFGDVRMSLCLDKKGLPHICYLVGYHSTNRSSWVRYAYRGENGKWKISAVQSIEGDSTHTAILGETSMALDAYDRPHVLYSVYKEGNVYAYYNGNNWVRQVIPNTIFNWPGNTLVLDSKNNPHIVIGHVMASGAVSGNNTSPGMEYFTSLDKGKSWKEEKITSDCWWECDIALDSNEIPFVVYRSLQKGVFIAKRTAKQWQSTQLDDFVQGGRPGIIFDNCNNAHVFSYRSYKWPAPTTLHHYFSSIEKGWQSDVVSNSVNGPCSNSIPGIDVRKDQVCIFSQMGENKLFFTQKLNKACAEKKSKSIPIFPDTILTKQNLVKGKYIVLKNILFFPNKTDLLPTSFTELNQLLTVMRENLALKIEIGGHTSKNSEGEKFNKELSEGRAEVVKQYLVDNGVDQARILSKGYGFSRPLYLENDEDHLSKNRRVEILVLSD